MSADETKGEEIHSLPLHNKRPRRHTLHSEVPELTVFLVKGVSHYGVLVGPETGLSGKKVAHVYKCWSHSPQLKGSR